MYTIKELEKLIAHERNIIKDCGERIKRVKFEKETAQKSLAFWRGELKAAKKNVKVEG